uniref:Uncharacterized protein n=1 Tax=Alexandrium monilatum TaxID=311494 RepID=A0A7S4VNT5_9DINO
MGNHESSPILPAPAEEVSQVLRDVGVDGSWEADARAKSVLEDFAAGLALDAQFVISMVETGIMPIGDEDLAAFVASSDFAFERKAVYANIKKETDALRQLMGKLPADLVQKAVFLNGRVKPKMDEIRSHVDKADRLMQEEFKPEGLMQKELYPSSHASHPSRTTTDRLCSCRDRQCPCRSCRLQLFGFVGGTVPMSRIGSTRITG